MKTIKHDSKVCPLMLRYHTFHNTDDLHTETLVAVDKSDPIYIDVITTRNWPLLVI